MEIEGSEYEEYLTMLEQSQGVQPEEEEKMKRQIEGLKNLKKLVLKTKRKDELDRELKEVKADIARYAEAAMEFFIQSGIKSMRIDDRTPYLYRQVFASIAEGFCKTDVKEALEKIGLEEFIGYNTQSLNGYIREELKKDPTLWNKEGSLIATDEQIMAVLPPALAKVLRVSEKIDIKVRK